MHLHTNTIQVDAHREDGVFFDADRYFLHGLKLLQNGLSKLVRKGFDQLKVVRLIELADGIDHFSIVHRMRQLILLNFRNGQANVNFKRLRMALFLF